jgi:hypothetical protein
VKEGWNEGKEDERYMGKEIKEGTYICLKEGTKEEK